MRQARIRPWAAIQARLCFVIAAFLTSGAGLSSEPQVDPHEVIKAAIEHERDDASYSVIEMIIHRADWERSMTLEVWTKGLEKSLMRVTSPKKDAGNGTLLLDDDMWTYTPKINRIIKLPSSMMHQSWMGSDFSNNDVAKSDDIIDQYDHTLLDTEMDAGKKVYVIEAIPHEEAPVVWGKEVVKVREDNIVLQHTFYDQDGQPVKRLKTSAIDEMGGKRIATRVRMTKLEAPEEWTEIRVKEANFDVEVPDSRFTLSNLRNPRI